MAITLTGIAGLDDLVITERQAGSPLITPAIIGNTSIENRSALGYPSATASAVKPDNFVVSCILSQAQIDLFQSYLDAQELDGERGNVLVQNTEYTITASQLAIGNRTQVGSAVTGTGITKYFYQFYGLIIVGGDYFNPNKLGSNSGGNRYEVNFTIEELWN